jgi:hypothetical protein
MKSVCHLVHHNLWGYLLLTDECLCALPDGGGVSASGAGAVCLRGRGSRGISLLREEIRGRGNFLARGHTDRVQSLCRTNQMRLVERLKWKQQEKRHQCSAHKNVKWTSCECRNFVPYEEKLGDCREQSITDRLSSHGTWRFQHLISTFLQIHMSVCIEMWKYYYIVLFNHVYRLGVVRDAALMRLFLTPFSFNYISQMSRDNIGAKTLRHVFHIMFTTSNYHQPISWLNQIMIQKPMFHLCNTYRSLLSLFNSNLFTIPQDISKF